MATLDPDSLARRQGAAARASLEDLCRQAPRNARLKLVLGAFYHRHREPAAAPFREAAELRPDWALPRLFLAATQERAAAREALEPLVQDPSPLENGPPIARGLARLLQRRPEEVRPTIRGSKRGRASYEEYLLIAVAEPTQAKRLLGQAGASRHRSLQRLETNLGQRAVPPEKLAKARTLVEAGQAEKALRLLPQQNVPVDALRARALALEAAGDPDEAADLWAEVAEAWESPLAAYAFWRAGRLSREADPGWAAFRLEQALARLPEAGDLRRETMEAWVASGRRDLARDLESPGLGAGTHDAAWASLDQWPATAPRATDPPEVLLAFAPVLADPWQPVPETPW